MCFRLLKYNLDFKLNLSSYGTWGGGTHYTASRRHAVGFQVPLEGSHLAADALRRTKQDSGTKIHLESSGACRAREKNILAFLFASGWPTARDAERYRLEHTAIPVSSAVWDFLYIIHGILCLSMFGCQLLTEPN